MWRTLTGGYCSIIVLLYTKRTSMNSWIYIYRPVWIIGMTIILSFPLLAQRDNIVQDVVHVLLEGREEVPDPAYVEALTERLEAYLHHPLDLNAASREELESLGILSIPEIEAILHYRKTIGPFTTVQELNAVEGLQHSTLLLLQPFVAVKGGDNTLADIGQGGQLSSHPAKWILSWRGKLDNRLTRENAFKSLLENGGLPQVWKVQYRIGTRFSAGIAGAQQRGETWRKYGIFSGPDQLQFHAFIHWNKGIIRDIALGDYSLQIGEGLIVYQGFQIGKSALVNRVHRGLSRHLFPYRSSGSFAFSRGAAAELGFAQHWSVLAFVSSRRLDATWQWLEDSTAVQLKSINRSGLHNTPGTLSRQSNLLLHNAGSTISYHKGPNRYSLNLMGQRVAYQGRQGHVPAVVHPFSGWGSFSYRQYVNGIMLFGEEAITHRGDCALLNGLLYAPVRGLGLSLVHRRYGENYSSIWSNALREATYIGNESGLYSGIEYTPDKVWQAAFYIDFWRFPAGSDNYRLPITGHASLWKLSYTHRKVYQIYALVKWQNKGEITSGENDKYSFYESREKINIRLHGEYILNRNWTLRARYETVKLPGRPANSYSRVLYQDVLYASTRWPLTVKMRYALYRAPDFEGRIYAYENGLSGTYSIPFYYGSGMRTYLYVRYRMKRLYTEAKLSYTTGRAGAKALPRQWSWEWRLNMEI